MSKSHGPSLEERKGESIYVVRTDTIGKDRIPVSTLKYGFWDYSRESQSERS